MLGSSPSGTVTMTWSARKASPSSHSTRTGKFLASSPSSRKDPFHWMVLTALLSRTVPSGRAESMQSGKLL